MGQWGMSDLESAVRWLSPEAKQAFYAAAASRTLNRGTWDGCAFNAGGEIIGVKNVNNTRRAAEIFNMPEKSVSRFISIWDSLNGTDEEANEALRNAIQKIGLFSPRGTHKLRVLVFEDQMERESERTKEIDAAVADETITDEQLEELVAGYSNAVELLGCNA